MTRMTVEKTRRGGRRKGAGRKPIPGRIRPFPFGSPPLAPGPTGKTCRPGGVHCRSRINPQHNRIFAVYCDSWSCPRCAEKLRETWKEHITRVTSHRDKGHLWNPASVFITSHPEWISSVRKHLQRHETDFICIKLRGQEVAVINNGKFGDVIYRSRSNSEIIEGTYGFKAALNEIFAAMDSKRRPISTSKEWQLKRHSTTDRTLSLWESVHFLSSEAFRELGPTLKKLDIPFTEHSREGKAWFEFDWPDSFSQADIAWRESRLAPIGLRLRA